MTTRLSQGRTSSTLTCVQPSSAHSAADVAPVLNPRELPVQGLPGIGFTGTTHVSSSTAYIEDLNNGGRAWARRAKTTSQAAAADAFAMAQPLQQAANKCGRGLPA